MPDDMSLAKRKHPVAYSHRPVTPVIGEPDVSRVNGSEAYICPKCGAHDLVRIRRRFGDRLLSIFVKLRRFRCTHVDCLWVGNLRQKKHKSS